MNLRKVLGKMPLRAMTSAVSSPLSWITIWSLICLLAIPAHGASSVGNSSTFSPPPTPNQYVTDTAGILNQRTITQLNRQLDEFEKATSSQILVYISRNLPTNITIEEFAVRTFQAWKPGIKGKDNGAILLIFSTDRKIRIEVGYGLEGTLPDIVAKRIIDEVIAPHFRAGDFNAGVRAGVQAIQNAARGELSLSGQGNTVYRVKVQRGQNWIFLLSVGVWLALVLMGMIGRNKHAGTIFGRQGRYHNRPRTWISFGGSSGGGFGGGFSGGGGRSGGGGASGGW